jgi:hypothetical protein
MHTNGRFTERVLAAIDVVAVDVAGKLSNSILSFEEV